MEDDQIKICYKKGEIIASILVALISLIMGGVFTALLVLGFLDYREPVYILCIVIFFTYGFISLGVDDIRRMLFYVILKGDTFIIRNEEGEKYEFQLSNIKKILERREERHKSGVRLRTVVINYWFIIVLESDVEIKLHYSKLKNLDKLAQYFIKKRESGQITRKVLPKGVERMLRKYKNEGEKMEWR